MTRKRKSTNTALAPAGTSSRSKHRDQRSRSVPPRPNCQAQPSVATSHSVDDTTIVHGRAPSSGIISIDSDDDSATALIHFQAGASSSFSVYATMINLLTKKASDKNVNSIDHETMFRIMNFLINNRNRILEEARNTDTITLTTKGKSDLVYKEANGTIPSVPPDLVCYWVVHLCTGLIRFCQSSQVAIIKSLDNFFVTLQNHNSISFSPPSL